MRAEAQSPFVFTDFCHKLLVDLKSMVYLYFFCSNAVDDAPINYVLSHFPALDLFCVKSSESPKQTNSTNGCKTDVPRMFV